MKEKNSIYYYYLLKKISIAKDENISQLNLSGKSIKKLPESIGELISLSFLNLSSNQLKKLPEESDSTSTEGIDVVKWKFKIDEEREFCINIWDFGGQEIYHATHQFFLTKRSLYTLVADSRKEDTDFYYWLNVVKLLSENSPLLIVKNEKVDRKRDINEKALRGQFENLSDRFYLY